jgi:hypothetical protein
MLLDLLHAENKHILAAVHLMLRYCFTSSRCIRTYVRTYSHPNVCIGFVPPQSGHQTISVTTQPLYFVMLICIAILQKVEFYSLGQVVEVKF